jgi:hypothetical protein
MKLLRCALAKLAHFGDWLTGTYYTKYLGIHPDTKVRQKSIKS